MSQEETVLLQFLRGLKAAPIADLLEYDRDSVPPISGVYLLIARPNATFNYPNGTSELFYIGQGTNLRERLNRRRQQIMQAKVRQTHRVYPPQFEYGATFGARFTYIATLKSQAPKELEDQVMAMFANRFHSLPVANGAGAWQRIRRIIDAATWS